MSLVMINAKTGTIAPKLSISKKIPIINKNIKKKSFFFCLAFNKESTLVNMLVFF
jgi:hypothetical protein